MNVLVTGASGFIGARLIGPGSRALVRQADSNIPNSIVGDLLDPASLVPACNGIDCIFHCAGFAHAFVRSDADLHWRINFEGTRNLVDAAGEAGVRRFVFLSSVKAMAEPGGECVDEDWPGAPDTSYGRAKRAAEDAVLVAGRRFAMHVVNLRLAMVYGRGGRGNLERMTRAIQVGWFPPLPETGNRRSLVHVDDVVEVMQLVAQEPAAAGRTYIVADPRPYSGREIYAALREVIGKRSARWHLSEAVLRAGGLLGDGIGRVLNRQMPVNSEMVSRLLDSACYSPAKIERELGWSAKIGLHEGVREMLGGDDLKRIFDLIVALLVVILLAFPLVILALMVRMTSPGPALYWSDRVGSGNRIFQMPKFRTMRIGTPAVATHLLANPVGYLTPIGSFLRRTSLDELPQIWSILRGDMSFVGPRPALFNQHDLVALRTERGVHSLVPGLTGWAQVNGRDDLPIPVKVAYDAEYLRRQSFWFDIQILWLTVLKVIRGEGVSH